ncbi:MAG TPA: hypothetical protein VL481_02285, partial [Verrucomicrobiae bacterium]|nr:hypothetical protein [Verrucomicrobiae bacterium]
MIRPRVAITLEPTKAHKNFIDIVVSNHGRGIARNITFRVEGDDFSLDHQHDNGRSNLSKLQVFEKGIKI